MSPKAKTEIMKNERKYYEISYTKAIGGTGTLNIIARNEEEALNNAYHGCFTGSDFRVVREIPPTNDTLKGPGRNRANK